MHHPSGRSATRLSLPFLILILAATATTADAGEHDGLAVGARSEQGAGGIGLDYWRGRFGITAALGASMLDSARVTSSPATAAWRSDARPPPRPS